MLDQKSISRIIILHLIAILFVILNISNVKIGGFSGVMPLLDVMIIFYFSSFKKTFAIWFIFLLGIWGDALNGNPLGLSSLCYILLVKFFDLLNNKMLIRENFTQVWRQFISFCFLFLFMKWAVISIFNGAIYSLTTPFVQLFFSSCVYILMHKFFDYLSKKLLEDN